MHVQPVTELEVDEALKYLNTGKAVDIYVVTEKHLLFASEAVTPVLVKVMNYLFSDGNIPDIVK